ncbi:hypothetical protein niasHT_003494 [Heterodera trifolii]|uniref:NADAR domain-containing protein n=1 Tax=Heterodera trifolii TaxID=157864 RepID=A0ABD2LVC8_9BILA
MAFQGANDPFSNFHFSPFVYEEERYSCVEQAFVMKKVRTFELHGVAAELMRFIHKDDPTPNSPRWPDGHPRELKWFGREAEERATPAAKRKWSENAQRSLIAFLVEQKFRQNQHLAALLLATNDTWIAEACKDRKWAVGYYKNDHFLYNYTPENGAFGRNWMGRILMNLRMRLIDEQQQSVAGPSRQIEPPSAPVYLIAQELANGLIGAKIEYDNAFPHFVLIPNCLLTCSLGIGDFFTPGKLQADDRFAVLASNVTEMTKERKLWINPNSSILAVQATVIDIKSKY